MRQKSRPEKRRRKTRSGTFGAQPVDTFQLKRRSTSYWKGCAGRRASPNSVGARASPHRCTTAGRRSSLRPARGDSPATYRAATSDEVKDLRREAQALKEVVADLTLENRLLKKV